MSKQQTDIELAGPLEAVFQNPDVVKENIKIFRETLPKLLDPKIDIVMIHGKPFKNKNAWNVIDQYFGVHTETTKSWVTQLPDDEFSVTVSVRAYKGVRSAGRSGTCTSIEMKEKHQGKGFAALYSHCHGMAETRGIERASGAFFMDADVSAEEAQGAPNAMKKESEYCSCPFSEIKMGIIEDGVGLCKCLTCKKQMSEIRRNEYLKSKGKTNAN